MSNKVSENVNDKQKMHDIYASMCVSPTVINTVEDLKALPSPTPYSTIEEGRTTYFIKATDSEYLVYGQVFDGNALRGSAFLLHTAESLFEIVAGCTVISASVQFTRHSYL